MNKIIALVVVIVVAGAFLGFTLPGHVLAANDQVRQKRYCWLDRNSDVAWSCDYTSYGACRDANAGKDGTCLPRPE